MGPWPWSVTADAGPTHFYCVKVAITSIRRQCIALDVGNYAVYTYLMSNTAAVRYDKNFMIRVDQRFLDDLDELREQHVPPLTRADYLRKLVIEAKRRAKR